MLTLDLFFANISKTKYAIENLLIAYSKKYTQQDEQFWFLNKFS